MDSQTVRQKHKDFLFPCVANYYAEPVVITEAHGSTVKDLDGREYLDFFGGILTAGIGHSHPEFVNRIQNQVARLVHTSSVYPTVEQVAVAERLTQITPGKLKKSFFTTSGTEADETAIMLAKIYTGQQEIIALRHSYAGRSQGAIAITGQQPWRVLPTQIAGVKHALSPYCYRCPLGLEYPDCGIRCAQDIDDLIRPRRAANRGKKVQDALEERKKRFAFIGDVRGMGLRQEIEFVEDRKTKEPSPKKRTASLEAATRQGLLSGKGGVYGNLIRTAPG